jgi:hypothetical protein
MNVDHSWNDTDRGKQKYWEVILLQCHFVHRKSHIDSPGIDTKPPAVRIRLLTPTPSPRTMYGSSWKVFVRYIKNSLHLLNKYTHYCGNFQVFTAVWWRASFFWDHHHHLLFLLPFQLRSSTIPLEVSFITVLLWGQSDELILVLCSDPFALKHVLEGKV